MKRALQCALHKSYNENGVTDDWSDVDWRLWLDPQNYYLFHPLLPSSNHTQLRAAWSTIAVQMFLRALLVPLAVKYSDPLILPVGLPLPLPSLPGTPNSNELVANLMADLNKLDHLPLAMIHVAKVWPRELLQVAK